MKKLILAFIFIFAAVTFSSFAQTVSVKSFGVTPRDVTRDTGNPKFFDKSYNGLLNVGKEVKVFLKGSSTLALTNPTWEFVSKPSGSNAVFTSPKIIDTSNQVVAFIPDVVGNYEIKFTDGTKSGTIFIDAGLYLGLGAEASCKNCHGPLPNDNPGIYNKWLETGHANIFTEAMNGTLSDHYGPNCISCHTTGYIPGANNDGFDDRDFVYPTGPDSLGPNTWNWLLTNSPNAMKLANIQCESCHGPGSGHVTNPYAPQREMKSLLTENCAWCHDSGSHHGFPEQWRHSGDDATEFDGRGFEGGHAKGYYVTSADRNGCSPCHSGSGYVQWVKEGRPVDALGLPAATLYRPPATNITCAVCHDPHDASNLHQLRYSDTQLGDGTPVTFEQYGTGAQCMDCHRSRRYAKTYANDINNQSAHYGAHHGPQADMLLGKNAPDYGIEFPSSPHAVAGGNACVDCHMAGELTDPQGNINLVGGHSFNMNDAEGNDHVEACAPCHGNVGTSFKDKKYYINGNADLNGDGIAQGLQLEIHGLMEQLGEYLPHDASGNVSITTTNADSMALTPAIMRAGYVYFWIEEDRSFGIHNPAFTFALLKTAIEDMGGVVSVDYPTDGIPQQYQLAQNYPNPFNPATTINYTIPEQSNVKVIIYDVLGNQVEILTDDVKSPGTYSVKWNAAKYSSGIYFYKLETDKFVQVRKMILMK
ncbi:MAG TPA: T9SS type A sorting domain-containing protein [Ignavibacteriaceae bacterium]